jgi:glycosyltransferase involved in cell wall biosynthesis
VSTAKLPKISVIIPSLNHQGFIDTTLRSVLDQNYPNLELWVIDGGSTDGTVERLKNYGDAVSWISEPDHGQADAVNKGFARATGEIFGWLNSDDTYLRGALRYVGEFFADHPSDDAAYGDAYYVDRDGEVVRPYDTRDFDLGALANECYVCQPAVFFRRHVLADVGMLDASLRVALDYDFWIRLFRTHPPVRLPRFLATFRMYPENKTLALRSRAYREIVQTLRKHYGFVPYSWSLGHASYLWHRNDQFHDPRRASAPVFVLALLAMTWYNRYNPRYLWNWITSSRGFRSEFGKARARRFSSQQRASRIARPEGEE